MQAKNIHGENIDEIKSAFSKATADSETYKTSGDLARFAKETFKDPAIIVISSGLTINADDIINGIKDVDKSIPLYGGLAGDDLTMKASYVFSNHYESSNGLIGLVLDNDKVNITGLATSGWDDIGNSYSLQKV